MYHFFKEGQVDSKKQDRQSKGEGSRDRRKKREEWKKCEGEREHRERRGNVGDALSCLPHISVY